jgi:hypothetical protein
MIATVALAALIAFMLAGGPSSRAAASGGGTTVSVQGTTANITVHMDILGAVGGAERDVYGALLREYAKQAAAMWNKAFAMLPAEGCVALHLAIDVHVLARGERPDPAFHQIQMNFTADGRDGIDEPPGSTIPATADWTDPYTSDLTGHFYLGDMSARIFAHETGHLLGLGDDYTDQYIPGVGPSSVNLPGREGTLMDGGDTIDQDLVNRIATEATKAGDTLPTCHHWAGRADVTTHTTYHGPSYECPTTQVDDDTFNLTVGPDGTIQGTGTQVTNITSCGPGTHRVYDYHVSGQLTGGQFHFTDLGGIGSAVPTVLAVPLSSSKTTAATQFHGGPVTQSSGDGFSAVSTFSGTVTLTQTSN